MQLQWLISHLVIQVRVQIPWFIQTSWDLSVLRASTGWTFQLNTWNIRPWGTEIFLAVKDGQVEYIVESLKNRQASIYDMDPYGNSLLHVSCHIIQLNMA